MSTYDVIIKPVLTEKGYQGIESKMYAFIVSKKATKGAIKTAVEKAFNVKVERVNTVNCDGKNKRMGKGSGKTPDYKKAYVTLTSESKPIEFFESLS